MRFPSCDGKFPSKELPQRSRDTATWRDFQVEEGLNPSDYNSKQDLSISNEKETQSDLELFHQNDTMTDQVISSWGEKQETQDMALFKRIRTEVQIL